MDVKRKRRGCDETRGSRVIRVNAVEQFNDDGHLKEEPHLCSTAMPIVPIHPDPQGTIDKRPSQKEKRNEV